MVTPQMTKQLANNATIRKDELRNGEGLSEEVTMRFLMFQDFAKYSLSPLRYGSTEVHRGPVALSAD